ncbi:MAG: putative DNA binding domain-containing protein [Treponema sp.]|nr:putative DNA binding domain-containing protein [Treponema sp.]
MKAYCQQGALKVLESTTIEFKREYNEKVTHTMLAFLNTEGGELYLGLSDDGAVYGVAGDIDLEARRVTTSFRDSVTPDPSGYFKVEPEKREGNYILKITVGRGSAIPYCLSRYGLVPQGVYVRVGSSTVMATREHIRRMIKDNGAGQFTVELSIEQELTFEYADGVFAGKDMPFGDRQKQSLGLVRPDGRYTNLALILSDQCPFNTKAAIFEGTSKEKFKDRKEFSGSLFKQIDEVLAYLTVYNRVRGTFEGTAPAKLAYRVDHPDFPSIALREAYINALIHRDYYIEGSVLVSMFDDRLEFMSLGGVMPGVTHDLMLAGVSVTRNEKLAHIFYRLAMIEAFGTGIPRIYSAYESSAAKPEIPVIDGGFLIRVPNMNYRAPLASENSIATGPNEKRLLAAFPDSGFSKEEAAEVLGISASGAYKLLQRMRELGLLTSQKSGKKLLYTAVQNKQAP